VNFNWNNIRNINGSQNNGFEEFVCQIAGKEIINNQKRFYRIGKPDGGKECFWEFEDGTIYCWQAKYFVSALTPSQWAQINKSVTDVIDNHPALKCHILSIPIDMPDGKEKGKKSFLDKWKEQVAAWKRYAINKGAEIEFEFWGSYELIKRLSKTENEGLAYFWFNEMELTDEWFDRKNNESIDILGGRYTPELNFELPISQIFDGLSRNENFKEHVNNKIDKLFEKFRAINFDIKNEELINQYSGINLLMKDFETSYDALEFSGNENILFDKIFEKTEIISTSIDEIQRKIYELKKEEEKNIKKDFYSSPFSNESYYLREFKSELFQLQQFLRSEECEIANKPYALITGKAGIGKSHLIADIIKIRNEQEYSSLLLLGENFSSNDMPWTQILNNQLRIKIDEFIFLGALNAKAESKQSRIIIFIDAINEGQGRSIWPSRLKAFINSFHHYPWLGLVMSLRSSYINLIAPENIIDPSLLVRVRHGGFAGVEYEASNYFFKHYKIKPPGTPLLDSEFQYPLFLKLFCEGLFKRNLSEIPQGYEGISVIINFFIESIEFKLSQPNQLNYDIRLKPVRNSIHKIVALLAERNSDRISYSEANGIINSEFFNNSANPEPFLARLINEGVFNTDLFWIDDKHHEEGVHFAYQRFQDHLLARLLLEKHLDKDSPSEAFTTGGLATFVSDSEAAYHQQNIIESFSIQLPEMVGKELYELAPHAANYYSVSEAFIDSLIWRRSYTISSQAVDYVKNVIGKSNNLFYKFLETIISNSSKPEFYFNASWLHKLLIQLKMPVRDNWWTIWLQDKYGENSQNNSIKRLIDWAWKEEEKTYLDDKSLKLAGLTLAWFLTSSNRYLRDSATKALICIFQDKILILIEVIKDFSKIDDPYVYERLFAVAYGCTLRTNLKNELIPLAEYIYSIIFKKRFVYPHILLRDYARNIIEYVLKCGLILKIDEEKIRPPYKSNLPKKLPTLKEIDNQYNPRKKDGDYEGKNWGSKAILNSMTTEYGRGVSGYGDFGRYTFESALKKWKVNVNGLSNLAIERIFKMGYDPAKFTNFDRNQGSGRHSGHLERIGKKYQWIAFYEILAKVSDNHKLKDESSWRKEKVIPFDGTWYPYVRDIDPSIVIKKTQEKSIQNKMTWWYPELYNFWNNDFNTWMKSEVDLPNPKKFLSIKDKKGVEWFNLHSYPEWNQPKKPGQSKWHENRERVWYHTGSWIVSTETFKHIKTQFENEKVKIQGPDLANRYEIFSREYYWSSAWKFFQRYYYTGGESFDLEHIESEEKYGQAFYTACYYLWEEEFDCSKEEKISFLKPSKLLFSGLNYSRKEGQFANKDGDIICFDPSIYDSGPSSLLFRKERLIEILKSKGMHLIWIVSGEKQIIGSAYDNESSYVSHSIEGLYYLDSEFEITGSKRSKVKAHKN